MPRIWADTMEGHRRQVNDAILDATADLIGEQGPLSVAMSAIADRAGIGRATLYKYFPDVESILVAWHTRDFGGHLHRLEALSEADEVTLNDLAEFVYSQRRNHPHHGAADVVAPLAHTLAGAAGVLDGAIEREIIDVLTALLIRLADRKEARDDQDPELLAQWLLHATHAPSDLDDKAVAQLVADSLAPKPSSRRHGPGGRAPRPA